MSDWRYILDGEDAGSLTARIWHGPQGQPLEIDGPNSIDLIDWSATGLNRYTPLLPVDPAQFRTLGAGMTPLVSGTLAGQPALFKLDGLLPSGSFKDRGAAASVALLKAQGTRKIVVDSSGNAAAAMSAYCAAAGIDCTVYAPANASAGKLVQSRAYGATVELIEGTRDDVASAAQAAASTSEDVSYVSHNWSPVFAEGVKTWAIEVWEQLGERAPQRVYVPTGGGSALAGAWRGFLAAGDVPEIVACQPAACAPLVHALNRSATGISPVEPGATIAEGARISNPPRNGLLLNTLRNSSGRATSVDESELQDALRALWQQGIYAEPTAALGAAAFIKDVNAGVDLPGASVVLITGTGLKATETIGKILD